MAGTLKLTIGSDVLCEGARVGRVRRLIVDPDGRRLTHLDVDSDHHHDEGRLVPAAYISATPGPVELSCSSEQFSDLAHDTVETIDTAPGGIDQTSFIQSWDWGFDRFSQNDPYTQSGTLQAPNPPEAVIAEVELEGEVDLREHSNVFAQGHLIGHIDGLLLDAEDHHVTHLLLVEGHLFGKKEVAVPIETVQEVQKEGAFLSLSKSEVEKLPPTGD